LKQHCGVERSQVRSARGQANHILFSVRAYLRLEVHRLRSGMSAFEAKCGIVRDAIRAFLADPSWANLASA
ncbi:MAG: IS4/IS5 family transposase, partial [Bacteroidota bacterium]